MHLPSWTDFEMQAKELYSKNPMKVRSILKYSHNKKVIRLKVTDNMTCLQFRTRAQHDFDQIAKFTGNIMRQMATTVHLHLSDHNV